MNFKKQLCETLEKGACIKGNALLQSPWKAAKTAGRKLCGTERGRQCEEERQYGHEKRPH